MGDCRTRDKVYKCPLLGVLDFDLYALVNHYAFERGGEARAAPVSGSAIARPRNAGRAERLRRDRERHRRVSGSTAPELQTGNTLSAGRALETTAQGATAQLGNNDQHAEVVTASVEEQRERHRSVIKRSRTRETPAARSERLRRDRERHQRASGPTAPEMQTGNTFGTAGLLQTAALDVTAQSDDDGRHAEIDHARGIGDEIPRLHPVSAASKRNSLRSLQLALGARLDEIVCAVCDRSHLQKTCRVIKVSDTVRMQQLRELLSIDGEALPVALISNYDCSGLSSVLEGVLLSKRGVRSDGSLHVCQECDGSLVKLSIPKFSIKNGFFVGTLPLRFSDMTLPERLMTQTVSVVAVTRVMRGGAHRAIRSHCLAFDATPGPSATLLPTPIGSLTSYRVY